MLDQALATAKNKLLKAVQGNNENEVLLYLCRTLNVCHWTEISYKHTGDTILHFAARSGQTKIVNYLMEHYDTKPIDIKNKDDKTALHEAAQFSQYTICEILINYGANINALKRADWTPLMLACSKTIREKSIKTVEFLLSHGAIVNCINKDGWSCLHLVAREGNEDVLKLLIEAGLDVKIKTKNGRSALHIAALHGNWRILEILLNLGLYINEKDNCGNTALCEAVLGNHLETFLHLIEWNAETTVVNNIGYNIVHLAACEGHIDVLELILNKLKFDINYANTNNLTALHCAARTGKLATYEFLKKNGASESIVDNFKRTPSDYLKTSDLKNT